MADDQTPKRTPKRPRFFKSQFLELRDFEDEQTYHLEMLRRHNRGLHGWGIVRDGLQVTLSSDKTGLLISPGSAIDNQGQEIVLDKEGVLLFQNKGQQQQLKWNGNAYELSSQQIKEAAAFTGSPVDFYLTITFQESKSDDPLDQYPPPGGKVDVTRWRQTPLLKVEKTLRDDGSSIKLARVNVTKDGALDPPDMSVRPLAGCLGPLSLTSGDGKAQFGIDYHAQSDSLRIRARAKDASALDATHITIKRDTGNVGIGTVNPQAMLQVGEVKKGTPSLRIGWGAGSNEDVLTIYYSPLYNMGLRRGNRDLKIFAQSPEGDGHIYLMPNNTVAMSLLSNGNVGIGTINPQLKLDVRGDLKISGTVYGGADQPFAHGNYEIYLRGSSVDSSEGAETFLKINNIPISMEVSRGLNTVILNPNGTYKTKQTFDVYKEPKAWDNWAQWVGDNAKPGDVVAVGSYGAISDVPKVSLAELGLAFIGATEILKPHPTGDDSKRGSYALVFVITDVSATAGAVKSIEVCTPYKGPNAHIKTSYYGLLNLGIAGIFLGNVGIGTDKPKGRIDVRDSKGKAFLWNSDKNHHSFFGATEGGNAHLTGNLYYDDEKWNRLNPKKGGAVWWAGNDGTLGALQIGDGDNPVNKDFSRPLFIDANGNIGIGTGTPNGRIDVRDSKGRAFLWNSDVSDNRIHLIKKGDSFFGATEGGYAYLAGNLYHDGTKWNRFKDQAGAVWWAGNDGTLGAMQVHPPYNFSMPLFIASNGRVGIGTDKPSSATLVVEGGVGVLTDNVVPATGDVSYFSRSAQLANADAKEALRTLGHGVSIYATAIIWAGGGFVSSSDARIKNILGRSDSAQDLRTLLGIEVTDFSYKDVIQSGSALHKKVVGQQLEQVFPQAVSVHTAVVPDIYQHAPVQDGWITLATDLEKGDRVKLITERGQVEVREVLAVTEDKFSVDFKPEGDKVFVFGREVNDFRNVDYDAIAMLNVSATQQLKKEKDEEVTALRTELTELKAVNDALISRLQMMESKMPTASSVMAAKNGSNGNGRH